MVFNKNADLLELMIPAIAEVVNESLDLNLH